MKFSKIIKKLRQEQDWTQTELASRLSVSRSTVCMWEQGERLPTLEKMEEIGDLFNIDLDYLYGRSDVRQQIHFDGDGNEMVYFSDDKKILINKYEQMDDDAKLRLMEYIDFMLAIQKQRGK